MPLDSFEEPPKSSPARPGTAQLDGWRPPSAKDPAPESSAGPDEEEESANKGPAFDTTGVAMPTTARGAKGSAQVSSGPTDHDWMIKTESFGAAGAGMVADIYVDDVETPALPDSEFSVVSTVQVNPAGVLAQLPKTPPSDASASSLRGLAYQHDMAETEQVDPAAQLSGLEDDPLAKTQLDPEDSVDMAAQLAAFAASQGLTPTPALSEAETALLNPAQHLPPEALQPPDPEGTMRLHRRDESEEALTTNSKASLVGWIVLIVSVLLVIALFTWIATR